MKTNPLILCIDTATSVCSVALAEGMSILGIKESSQLNSHSSMLTILIQQLLEECNQQIKHLDAIAISKGPGSYTGLRIGVSAAKGFCYALDIPLIAVCTLKSMAARFSSQKNWNGVLRCPMIDARRMEVYTALYDDNLKEIFPVSAEIINENSFSEILQKKQILFFGDGAEKCKTVLSHQPNAVFESSFAHSAETMVHISSEAYQKRTFEDVAYFEPFYLKEFIAGKPSVKGLK